METKFRFVPRDDDFDSRRKHTVLYSYMGTTCCCCCCVHWLTAAAGGIVGYRSGWKRAEQKYGPVNRSFRKQVAWAAAAGCLLGVLFLFAAGAMGNQGEVVLVAFAFVPILFLIFPAALVLIVSDILDVKPWQQCLWMFIYGIAGTLIGYPFTWMIFLWLD